MATQQDLQKFADEILYKPVFGDTGSIMGTVTSTWVEDTSIPRHCRWKVVAKVLLNCDNKTFVHIDYVFSDEQKEEKV